MDFSRPFALPPAGPYPLFRPSSSSRSLSAPVDGFGSAPPPVGLASLTSSPSCRLVGAYPAADLRPPALQEQALDAFSLVPYSDLELPGPFARSGPLLAGLGPAAVFADAPPLAPPLSDGSPAAREPRPASDEDEGLTPAQSKRKAQNRAAQRAFRERKEKRVKELQAKLADLESAQQQSSAENELLKRRLERVSTENEILRATWAGRGARSPSLEPEPAAGRMHYQAADFYSSVLQHHPNKAPSHRIVVSDDGERLLAVAATWDYIVSHHLYRRGLVDMARISETLKDCVRCDGQGPVFAEGAILKAIEQAVVAAEDDLL